MNPASILPAAALILTAILLQPIPAAAQSPAAEAIGAFAGEPYRGRVTVQIIDPEDPGRPLRTGRGGATAQFAEDEDGAYSLSLIGSIDADGDAGFVVLGVLDDAGWLSIGGDVSLRVGLDGAISGGGVQDGQDMRFEGQVTPASFTFSVDTEMLTRTAGGFPAGTIFRFAYDLNRRPPGAGDDAAAGSDGECRNIVWQFRNVATFGGAMSLIQVPVCVN